MKNLLMLLVILSGTLKAHTDLAKNPAAACGLWGSVEKRILDCAGKPNSQKGNFILVTRTEESFEIHKDLISGLLWGDPLFLSDPQYPQSFTHSEGHNECTSRFAKFANIKSIDWRLPTKEEFMEADGDGIRSSFPNMRDLYWTSLESPYTTSDAWVYNGFNGLFIQRYWTYGSHVRCVGNKIPRLSAHN